MAKQTQTPMRANKQPPQRFRIKHSFPAPHRDDAERFKALVRMMLRLGKEKK